MCTYMCWLSRIHICSCMYSFIARQWYLFVELDTWDRGFILLGCGAVVLWCGMQECCIYGHIDGFVSATDLVFVVTTTTTRNQVLNEVMNVAKETDAWITTIGLDSGTLQCVAAWCSVLQCVAVYWCCKEMEGWITTIWLGSGVQCTRAHVCIYMYM